jgi:hypothetical protein
MGFKPKLLGMKNGVLKHRKLQVREMGNTHRTLNIWFVLSLVIGFGTPAHDRLKYKL